MSTWEKHVAVSDGKWTRKEATRSIVTVSIYMIDQGITGQSLGVHCAREDG